jgi:hypothetical protein
MKKLSQQIILLITICLVAFSVSSAQIPNAGFETWSSGSPTGWITDNIPTIASPITKSSDAHSGSSSLQGQVISYLTVALPPTAMISFPISAHYGSLIGYYKYSPVGGDSLVVVVAFFKSGTGIATGVFLTGTSVSTYTQFTAPIIYAGTAIPDSAYIDIVITNPSGKTHNGSTFIIDDLAFGAITDVQEPVTASPAVFSLSQNYPNPFNPSTMITYQIPTDGTVRLEVIDVMGRTLTTLVNEQKPAGHFTVPFDGSKFASGIYFYRINVIARDGKSFSQTNKMILMK